MKRVLVFSLAVLFLIIFMIGEVKAQTNVYTLDADLQGECIRIPWNNFQTSFNATLDKYLVLSQDDNFGGSVKNIGKEDIQLLIQTEFFNMNTENAGVLRGYFHMNNSQIRGYFAGTYVKNEYGVITLSGELIGSNTINGLSRGNDKDYIIQITGRFKMNSDLNCSLYLTEFEYESINNGNERILALESWKQSINTTGDYNSRISALESWKQSINNTITTILNTLTGHTTSITSHESKITTLENKNCTCQAPPPEIFPSYLMKLSSNDRKDIVCAYAESEHLLGIEGLGWTCGLTYKTSNSGRVSVSCKCKK